MPNEYVEFENKTLRLRLYIENTSYSIMWIKRLNGGSYLLPVNFDLGKTKDETLILFMGSYGFDGAKELYKEDVRELINDVWDKIEIFLLHRS